MFISRKLANGIKIVEKSKKIPPPIQPINATKTVNGGRILQTGVFYYRTIMYVVLNRVKPTNRK